MKSFRNRNANLKVQIALIAFLLILPALVIGSARATSDKPSPLAPALLKSLPCEKQVLDTLINWGHPYEWSQESRFGRTTVLKSSTGAIGHWVKLKVDKKRTRLSKITPRALLRFDFSEPQCQAALDTDIKPKADPSSFSDNDLARILKRSQKASTSGIIYAWSPNMNFSAKGWAEAKKIAQQLKLEFHLVHDSHVKLKPKLKAKTQSRKLASVELIERGMEVHYPALLFYKNGRLEKYARPGYDDPKRLKALLKKKVKD